jgi:hypothetical protein
VGLLVSLSTVPESPIWLLGHRSVSSHRTGITIQYCRGDMAAYDAISWLRASEKINDELDELDGIRLIYTSSLVPPK